jgi:hypothetical protein
MRRARDRTPFGAVAPFLKISSARNRPPLACPALRLKISRGRTSASKSQRVAIRRDGLLLLPPGLVSWRSGQRIFLCVVGDCLVLSATPRKSQNGRLRSVRVKLVRVSVRRQNPRRSAASS